MTELTLQQQRVLKVLERLAQHITEYGEADHYSYWLETELDFGLENDAFGTEGQCDPRGDRRSGEWSMYHVQGVDG